MANESSMCYRTQNQTWPCFILDVQPLQLPTFLIQMDQSNTIVICLHLYLYCQLFIRQNMTVTSFFINYLMMIYNEKLKTLFSVLLLTCYNHIIICILIGTIIITDVTIFNTCNNATL